MGAGEHIGAFRLLRSLENATGMGVAESTPPLNIGLETLFNFVLPICSRSDRILETRRFRRVFLWFACYGLEGDVNFLSGLA